MIISFSLELPQWMSVQRERRLIFGPTAAAINGQSSKIVNYVWLCLVWCVPVQYYLFACPVQIDLLRTLFDLLASQIDQWRYQMLRCCAVLMNNDDRNLSPCRSLFSWYFNGISYLLFAGSGTTSPKWARGSQRTSGSASSSGSSPGHRQWR